MTYQSIDQSTQDAKPVGLFAFSRGSNTYRFTDIEVDYVADDGTYAAVIGGLEMGDIEATRERVRNSPKIKCTREFDIALWFLAASPSETIGLVYREVNRGDTNYAARYVGRITGVDWNGAGAELACQSIEESGSEDGLKLHCGTHCEAVFLGDGCNLNPADFDYSTTIAGVDGVNIVVAALNASLPYAGGQVVFTDGDGNIQRRMIDAQPVAGGVALTLTRPFVDIIVTDAVVLYPGCDHTVAMCSGTYGNILNYRGRPHKTTTNPMAGQSIA